MDCLLQIAPSGFDFIQVDEPNLRTQNDFGFASVSADYLDLEQNSKKCPSVVELFYTECGHEQRDYFAWCKLCLQNSDLLELDGANLRTQNDFGFAIVSAKDLDLEQNF